MATVSNWPQRLLAALLVTAFHCDGRAQQVDEPDIFVLRTYEVGDLVVKVPDYAADPAASGAAQPAGMGSGGGGGFGGAGGGFFNVADQGDGSSGGGPSYGAGGAGGRPGGSANEDPMQITFDTLIDAMVNVVDPDTWAENGAGEGDVGVVGAALVVRQTPAVHEGIADFLAQLREGSATRRTVAVDARWLLLNSDDLDALRSTTDDGRTTIDRKVLEVFTRRPGSLRGITNCFSGQSVYLISGTRRNVVRSYIPVVGSVDWPSREALLAANQEESGDFYRLIADETGGGGGMYGGGRSVGYQPVVETPNFGVSLRIRPTLMHRENAAVTDLSSTITFPSNDVEGLDAPAPMGLAPRVDRLAIDTQELATTLRVPLGEPVLVGGMSHIAPAASTSADETTSGGAPSTARGETPQLYLVLEVR
jgi:hypothetical protein